MVEKSVKIFCYFLSYLSDWGTSDGQFDVKSTSNLN